MKHKRVMGVALAAAVLLSTTGCGTILGLFDSEYESKVYVGIQWWDNDRSNLLNFTEDTVLHSAPCDVLAVRLPG